MLGLPDRDRRITGNDFRKRESRAGLFASFRLPRGRQELIGFHGFGLRQAVQAARYFGLVYGDKCLVCLIGEQIRPGQD
jgi:hypothetical protein